MWVISGLSARYNNDDCASSTDSSVLSRCSSPQVDLESSFHSPEGTGTGSAFSPVESLEGAAEGGDGMLDDSTDNADEICCSLGDVTDWSRSPTDVFTCTLSPLSCGYGSLPANVRRNKYQRILRTAVAPNCAVMSPPRDCRVSHKMSHSLDESDMKSGMHVTSSTPDLSEFQRNSRSLSEKSDRRTMKLMTEGERRSAGLHGSFALLSHVRNSFRQHLSADSKRRQRRVAKHVFTADSSEPQLVSLRRFCDDYRTCCLQQNLTARRCSLDRMLSDRDDVDELLTVTPANDTVSNSFTQRLSNVTEEPVDSLPSSAVDSCCPTSDIVFSFATEYPACSVSSEAVEVDCRADVDAGAPRDDGLRRTADGDDDSDQLKDSVSSCVILTSVITMTTDDNDDVNPRCDDSVCDQVTSLADTPVITMTTDENDDVGRRCDDSVCDQVTSLAHHVVEDGNSTVGLTDSDAEGRVRVLSDVRDVDQLIDDSCNCRSLAAASHLPLCLDHHMSERAIIRSDELVGDDGVTEDDFYCCTRRTAANDLDGQSSTSGEVCVEWLCRLVNDGPTDAVISRSTDAVINLSWPSEELSEQLSQNSCGDVLYGWTETSDELTEMCADYESETYKHTDAVDQQCGTDCTATLVNDDDEQTWL